MPILSIVITAYHYRIAEPLLGPSYLSLTYKKNINMYQLLLAFAVILSYCTTMTNL
jgi:hypothetical protein